MQPGVPTNWPQSEDEFVQRKADDEVRVKSWVRSIANIQPFLRLNTLYLKKMVSAA